MPNLTPGDITGETMATVVFWDDGPLFLCELLESSVVCAFS